MFAPPLAQPPTMKVKKYLAAAIFSFGIFARGATIVVPVSEDTSLFEGAATSNLGASDLGAGSTAGGLRMRALMRFDLSTVPAGATITAAELTVTVKRVPGGIPPGSTFELHGILKDWGEGVKGGTLGAPATDDEATWAAPRSPGPLWTSPGASASDDTVQEISSAIAMNLLGEYTFPSTPAVVADVQSWFTNPASNFGWLMKSASEDLPQSARRFTSREGGVGAPSLTVTYTLAATELKIQQFDLRPAGMFLAWIGGSPPYRVERAENILGPWLPVTADITETQATAPADVPSAFYRVVSVGP